MKTAQDFIKQQKIKEIKRWTIHNCSICDYPCGYIFMNYMDSISGEEGTNVLYDNGCNCVSYKNFRESSFEAVANQYNIQVNPEIIKKMDLFWGFNNHEIKEKE